MGSTPALINAGASKITVKIYTDTAVIPIPSIKAALAVRIKRIIRLPPLMMRS